MEKLKTYKLLQAISFTTANLTVNENHVSSPHHWRVNCVCVPICVGHVISNRELVLHDWPPAFLAHFAAYAQKSQST